MSQEQEKVRTLTPLQRRRVRLLNDLLAAGATVPEALMILEEDEPFPE